MVPTRSQPHSPSPSSTQATRSLRLENAGPGSRGATVLLSTPDGEPLAHLVRLADGVSTTLPLPDRSVSTTVECHLDGGRGSAVLTVGVDTDQPPVLRLRRSSVVVAR